MSACYNEDREEESYKIMYGRKKVDGPKETEGDVDNPEFSTFLALFVVLYRMLLLKNTIAKFPSMIAEELVCPTLTTTPDTACAVRQSLPPQTKV